MLFESFSLRGLALRNRLVMAPMTRNRAIGNVPNALMADYYAQRASIGLIITEGIAPSPNGLGYARIPGLFSPEQVAGWKLVTDAVHAQGGRIVAQLMHTGRVGHVASLPAGARVLGPTDKVLGGEIYVDGHGNQPPSQPVAMTEADIATAVAEFAQAARNAVAAGFDGIELHAANGYLIEQFLNANLNTRTDGYGGSVANRNRFALEVARATAAAIGGERVGVRVSPYGVFNEMGGFADMEAQYLELVREFGRIGLAYLHLVDHSSMGAPEVPVAFKAALKQAFGGPFIASGGLDRAKAEQLLASGAADLVAFGRPVLANPDFVERLRQNAPQNAPDFSTFYTPGEKGYTDYPVLVAQ